MMQTITKIRLDFLSPKENDLLRILFRNEKLSKRELLKELYTENGLEIPKGDVIGVLIHGIRSKSRAEGGLIEIETLHLRGYRLTVKGRMTVIGLMRKSDDTTS